MKDWLGNELSIGDLILYSSTSTLTGMNLGEITNLIPGKVQIKLWHISGRSYVKGRTVTLSEGQSAYDSVTKYFGPVPEKDSHV